MAGPPAWVPDSRLGTAASAPHRDARRIRRERLLQSCIVAGVFRTHIREPSPVQLTVGDRWAKVSPGAYIRRSSSRFRQGRCSGSFDIATRYVIGWTAKYGTS